MSTDSRDRNSGIRAACDHFRGGVALDTNTTDEARISVLEIKFSKFAAQVETQLEMMRRDMDTKFAEIMQQLKVLTPPVASHSQLHPSESDLERSKAPVIERNTLFQGGQQAFVMKQMLKPLISQKNGDGVPIQQPNYYNELSKVDSSFGTSNVWNHDLQQIIGIHSSDSMKVFTFDRYHTTGNTEFNSFYAELDADQHTLNFANCLSQRKASMNARLVLYNCKDGNYNCGNYPSAGKMMFPKVYFLFLLVYLSIVVIWDDLFGEIDKAIALKRHEFIKKGLIKPKKEMKPELEVVDKLEAVRVSQLQHPNIIKLIGYCADDYERLLVYEYMPLGSLETFLHGKLGRVSEKRPLDWKRRMRIAADVASALNFLHSENVAYRALKSSSVLLGEDYVAKLSDLGFAKPVEDAVVVPAASKKESTCWWKKRPTAPEYAYTRNHTTKSDVYNFGILLLELISGIRPSYMVQGDGRSVLAEWARPLVSDDEPQQYQLPTTTDCPKHILKRAAQMALMCVEDEPDSRASINDVVEAMNQLVDDEQGDPSSKGGKSTEGQSTKGKDVKEKEEEDVDEITEVDPLMRKSSGKTST